MTLATLIQPQADASPSARHPRTASAGPDDGLPVVLALDLGQRTGWAMRLPDAIIASGIVEFRPGRFEGGGMVYVRFRNWLEQVHATNRLRLVVFEEVRRHAGTAASHAYGGFLAILTSWCEHHEVPYHGVPVGTMKRHIAGKGNARKDDVIAAVRALGFDPEDDNEADALAVLHWALANGVDGGVR